MRTAFSFYGGKGMHAWKYPKPIHDIIIEPFAGGAGYSLRYYKKKVLLIEKNPNVCSVWKFLQSKEAVELIEYIPRNPKPGEYLTDLLEIEKYPPGFIWFLRSAVSVGTLGIGKKSLVKSNKFSSIATNRWEHNTTNKIIYWHSKIQHWEILNMDYSYCPNLKATWFIDPPYSTSAGRRYFEDKVDYETLAKYCLGRKGQLIVCENEGANWLPFKFFNEFAGINDPRYYKGKKGEYLFYRE